ncbi:tetraprenyl-beta-curcumene synthase family protein [Bacillus infantis]|uniref:Tetraprenyl-beta-curcumene synthase family protein n=1 Tax=Bacillus infantis TaxID=324767 RepID=A0A5D4RW06_9BACI|nr:tetraprenyl-beta-curcumene synthase family protein [Bacillus infantis]TYS55523.1 tetraprenyl-beta-curcumene synthase family protein [Bacillus infantis]
MTVPSMPIPLMTKVYKKIIPEVHRELAYWRERAGNIPDPELRKQALASIGHKAFHCEGGAIMALLAKDRYKEAVRFIVAYQTVSDYLDNLCDRSTSQDPADFSALHEAMEDALSLEPGSGDYYRERQEKEDGGYLAELAGACRGMLRGCRHYESIRSYLKELCRYYSDLQIHKHVCPEERVNRLQNWHAEYRGLVPEMEWYEFSACSGSTLGIFSLVSCALSDEFAEEDAAKIRRGYFPYIQGLHILLDYLIDQEEDLEGGDLNFCFYYQDEQQLFARLQHFIAEADKHIEGLPHKSFHRLINRGLLGIYLSDEKVRRQKHVRRLARHIIKTGGPVSFFFYVNGRAYRTVQKWVPAGLARLLF